MTDADDVAKSWGRFCDDLKAVGEDWMSRTGSSPEEQAEAILFLTRMLRLGLEHKVDGGDRRHPRLCNVDRISAGAAIYAPNLDNTYYAANIDVRETYSLRFNVRTIDDIVLTVQGRVDGVMRAWGNLSLSDLEVGPDGDVEVILGAEPHDGNWIPLEPGGDYLFVRIYYFDWDQGIPPALQFDCISATDPQAAYMPPEQLTSGLHDALDYITRTTDGVMKWGEDFFAHSPGPNQFPPTFAGPIQVITYGGTRFVLEPDEALIMDFEPPDARYWVVQWHHLPWGDAADFVHTITSLNHTQVDVDDDGRVRIVVAHRDPGVKNWLDTNGRREGLLMNRWIWTNNNPIPVGTVIPFDRLSESLNAGIGRFSPSDREQQLAARRAHLARRY